MSIIKSTKSGTYGMRVLPKIFYDNADYYFGTTYKDGDWCCSIHHKKDQIPNRIYIFPSNTSWRSLDEVLIDSYARIEYTFNCSRLFCNATKTPIPEELKKEPEMRTVKINNFHDFTILSMYFNTIDPKEKLELIKQLL
jgi:hypothetical protein